jgi:hypothetical protein
MTRHPLYWGRVVVVDANGREVEAMAVFDEDPMGATETLSGQLYGSANWPALMARTRPLIFRLPSGLVRMATIRSATSWGSSIDIEVSPCD